LFGASTFFVACAVPSLRASANGRVQVLVSTILGDAIGPFEKVKIASIGYGSGGREEEEKKGEPSLATPPIPLVELIGKS